MYIYIKYSTYLLICWLNKVKRISNQKKLHKGAGFTAVIHVIFRKQEMLY